MVAVIPTADYIAILEVARLFTYDVPSLRFSSYFFILV